MSLGLWAHISSITAAPTEETNAQGIVTNQEVCDKQFERDSMAIGHIMLYIKSFIQKELASIPTTSLLMSTGLICPPSNASQCPQASIRTSRKPLTFALTPANTLFSRLTTWLLYFSGCLPPLLLFCPRLLYRSGHILGC